MAKRKRKQPFDWRGLFIRLTVGQGLKWLFTLVPISAIGGWWVSADLSLPWILFFAGSLAAATAIVLNQGIHFLRAVSASRKLHWRDVDVRAELLPNGSVHGFLVGVELSNLADYPLFYEVERVTCSIEGSYTPPLRSNATAGEVPARNVMKHMLGSARPAPSSFTSPISGRLELEVAYGKKPDALYQVLDVALNLTCHFDPVTMKIQTTATRES